MRTPWPKLRAHCAQAARTLRPGRAHTAPRPRAQRSVAARTRSCRSAPGSVAAPSDHDTKIVSQPKPLPRVSQRSYAISQGAGCRVATQGRPSAKIQNLYRDSTLTARPCAHALPLAPRAGRPCRGAMSQGCWPYPGPLL